MLTQLDETLLHQAPWPFRMAGLSDHRFFDRYWFEALDPSGSVALIAGMGVYKNTGVLDGYVAVQHADRQHNVRWSRPLPADLVDLSLGPMSVEVIEPFRRLRLVVAPGSGSLACDLEWTSAFPPYVEAHHLEYPGARIGTDSTRYDQAGTWAGWVEVDSVRVERDDWWGARDHSWGVRPGVGGFEPGDRRGGERGGLFIWTCVATEDEMMQFQLREHADGRRWYFDGQLDHRLDSGRPSVRVDHVTHDITFVPGTRAYSHAVYDLSLADGRRITLDVTPVFRGWAYTGTGYDGGYRDGRGLGATRGDIEEHDVMELPDVETTLIDGKPVNPGHREQPARVLIDGRPTLGHCPVMTWGQVDRYDFGST